MTLTHEFRKHTLSRFRRGILIFLFLYLHFLFFPLSFWQSYHISKYIHGTRTKSSVVIVRCYNCKVHMLLNIFDIISALLHLSNSVYLYSTKILFLNTSIINESTKILLHLSNSVYLYS